MGCSRRIAAKEAGEAEAEYPKIYVKMFSPLHVGLKMPRIDDLILPTSQLHKNKIAFII